MLPPLSLLRQGVTFHSLEPEAEEVEATPVASTDNPPIEIQPNVRLLVTVTVGCCQYERCTVFNITAPTVVIEQSRRFHGSE